MENDLIKQFETVATQAAAVAGPLAEAQAQKKSLFAELSFLALRIELKADLQENLAMLKMVSKEGQFQKLRQCVSNAHKPAEFIAANGFITVTEKQDGKNVPVTYTKEQILNSEVCLFSVATAYKKMLDAEKQENPAKKSAEFSDEDAIALYAKETGQQAADIKKIPLVKAEAIKQGHLMWQQRARANEIAMLESDAFAIRDEFKRIYALAPDLAIELLNGLVDSVNNDAAAETETAIAA